MDGYTGICIGGWTDSVCVRSGCGEKGQRKKDRKRRGRNLGREDLCVERGWCLTGQRKKVYVCNSDSRFCEDIHI